MLANQLIISITGQEIQAKQRGTSYISYSLGFVPQMQSITVQDQTLIGSNNSEKTMSNSHLREIDIALS